MSADRLSYVPNLLPARARARARRWLSPLSWIDAWRADARHARDALAAPRVLRDEEIGRLVYYTNVDDSLARGSARFDQRLAAHERPLLLLHGVHLHAGAQEWRLLFERLRSERAIYVPDLPGFGASQAEERDCDAALYVRAIKLLIEVCASDSLAPVDVMAVGLTSEYAAQAVAALPDMVSTLTLIDPTGFAAELDQGALERRMRGGGSGLPRPLYERLARFGAPGFAALLRGIALPQGNPQSVYTRVHCPTLVLHARARKARYSTLARFVRWREHYSERELDSTRLSDPRTIAQLRDVLAGLSTAEVEPVQGVHKLSAG